MKNMVMAVLVAGVLLLPAGATTMAGGKLGGAGGADEFQRFATVTRDGSKLGIQPDRTALLGGKLGIGAGDD